MITFTRGNLLDAGTEALVNTVNTVGVMGKGIALMFREQYPENFRAYAAACERGQVHVGKVFVTERPALQGPRWIINFPTKMHWRQRSRMEWIVQGLADLALVIRERGIRSIAVPPLGAGNGGLRWAEVRLAIERALAELPDVNVLVYEPTAEYQNVAKRTGVEALTPARALVTEAVRRYWVLGIECTNLEVQKLGWFLERAMDSVGGENVLNFQFRADRYGPYSEQLRHLLDKLDGTYLHCAKRLSDAGPADTIWFDLARIDRVELFLRQGGSSGLHEVLNAVDARIDGFQSPLGMELLATVDWLLEREHAEATVAGIRSGLRAWPAGQGAAERKLRLFNDRLVGIALDRLTGPLVPADPRV
ncbi:MAG TPA: macro domain-containing protein [Terriglobales bacterium]|nr:macro domain-containing protein [Terriglobales bacterium]